MIAAQFFRSADSQGSGVVRGMLVDALRPLALVFVLSTIRGRRNIYRNLFEGVAELF